MLDALTWALTFGVAALVFWQPAVPAPAAVYYNYSRVTLGLRLAPPAWVFPFIWFLLYALITADIVVFAERRRVAADHHDVYEASFVLWLINLALNKAWQPLFTAVFSSPSRGGFIGLFVLAALVFGTALAILCVEAAHVPWWASVFLLGPYVLWTFFATLLAFAIALFGVPSEAVSGGSVESPPSRTTATSSTGRFNFGLPKK